MMTKHKPRKKKHVEKLAPLPPYEELAEHVEKPWTLSENDDRNTERSDLQERLAPILYLTGEALQGDPVIVALVPPDIERCQCEWSDQTRDTFGPKPLARCEKEPTVIAFQKRDPSDDVPTGAISLCEVHKVMVEHMYPGQCYYRRITSDHTIGDFA